MGLRRPTFRSATAFFLVTFSTAFLMTIGMRLTGWFTRAPVITVEQNKGLGIAIMIAVMTLAVGAGLRRMEIAELRSALLGAASVLLALPLSQAAISQSWDVATTIITLLGAVLLVAGLLVSLSIEQRKEGQEA
ncbi:hypothetical protein [Caulobacter henricii]|uniref:Uncharacterized protein n=1 Tax=Caulobacter henricii TaxID=69395 RepID=A0A0P0P449_9CAUL|nr:hypothetical protein [Caulobacter henricii]ALL15262.1 hypothetical protein AQ619_08475 [Caulobacter henricii]